ncbi:hypothetical protein D3C84_682660 [compost metagenome]
MLAVNHGQGFVGQRMGQAGLGNRHREGAEQGVRQGHCRPAAEAAVEGFQGGVDAQATGQTAHQRTDNQRDHHVHTGQAENQHDADRGNYSINHRYLKASEMSPADSLRRAASGIRNGFY